MWLLAMAFILTMPWQKVPGCSIPRIIGFAIFVVSRLVFPTSYTILRRSLCGVCSNAALDILSPCLAILSLCSAKLYSRLDLSVLPDPTAGNAST